MSKTVRYEIDPSNPPPLTEAQRARLKALFARPESEIDYSDIPDRGDLPLYRPLKTHTTVRLDADVLAWLKKDGKGYQTRINAILRAAMIGQLPAHPRRKAVKAKGAEQLKAVKRVRKVAVPTAGLEEKAKKIA